jgi:hypothetical protein
MIFGTPSERENICEHKFAYPERTVNGNSRICYKCGDSWKEDSDWYVAQFHARAAIVVQTVQLEEIRRNGKISQTH